MEQVSFKLRREIRKERKMMKMLRIKMVENAMNMKQTDSGWAINTKVQQVCKVTGYFAAFRC